MVGHNAHNKQPFQLEVWCLAGAVCLKNLPWDVFNRMQQPVVRVSARSWNDLLSWLKHALLPTSKAQSKFLYPCLQHNTTQPTHPTYYMHFMLCVHYHLLKTTTRTRLYSSPIILPSFQCRFLFCTENHQPPPQKKKQQLHPTQNKEQQQANHYPYIKCVCCVYMWRITRFMRAEWITQLMHWYWFLCSCIYATSMKDGGVVVIWCNKRCISNWLGRRSAGNGIKNAESTWWHGDMQL